MRPTLALTLMMTLAAAGCASSPTSDSALADALDRPLRLCAGALAGDDMAEARRLCLPVVAVYQAATGR